MTKLILKFIRHDAGNCRDYYRGIKYISDTGEEISKSKHIYCRLLNLQGNPDNNFENSWHYCSKDGEPACMLKNNINIEIV